ncbi:hypothetical protein H1R20_g3004, partial [Candolleomyces eurysporus]
MATLLQGIRRHLLPLLALGTLVTADKTFNIANGCPNAITIYVNGESRGSVAPGASIVNTVADNWTGFIYSNVNAPGGNTGAGTTKAGFVNQAGYYFIIKDQSNFNTGVSIVPSASAVRDLSQDTFTLSTHPFIYLSEQRVMHKGNLQFQVLRQHVHRAACIIPGTIGQRTRSTPFLMLFWVLHCEILS